ncbi:MAG: PepSY domain-containing protein [Acidobacteria bacterium]|nr:PepSY domain-containing protein [Acidobacteriota bacterium]
MTLQHLNRRLHLYLALSLSPWFLMYGVSSYVFSHPAYFQELDKSKGPLWTKVLERDYDVPVPQGDLRPLGAQIMKDAGLSGAFGAYRQGPNQINVYVYTFLQSTQAKYFLDKKKLVVEDRRFRFDQFLTGMHAKGGFEQDRIQDTLWGIVVDLVCLGFILWIVTGLVMWWSLPSTRGWGWVALLGGVASFALFMFRL